MVTPPILFLKILLSQLGSRLWPNTKFTQTIYTVTDFPVFHLVSVLTRIFLEKPTTQLVKKFLHFIEFKDSFMNPILDHIFWAT
jgi:hypothetical protein